MCVGGGGSLCTCDCVVLTLYTAIQIVHVCSNSHRVLFFSCHYEALNGHLEPLDKR